MLCVNLGLHDFDDIECLDILLSRYNDMNYVMNLGFADGIKLISKAKIKIAEDMLFQQWNAEHIYMKEDNFISFEDYKNRAFKNVNKPTKKEIHEIAMKNIAEAERIRNLDRKG